MNQQKNFSINSNTVDQLAVYCLNCNEKRRNRKKKIDKYESYLHAYNKSEDEKQKAVYREVERRIFFAAKEAQKRYNKKFKVDNVEISRKLFQNKNYICNVTGNILTPECFLEHHTLTFQLSKDKERIEIIASQCRVANPLKKQFKILKP